MRTILYSSVAAAALALAPTAFADSPPPGQRGTPAPGQRGSPPPGRVGAPEPVTLFGIAAAGAGIAFAAWRRSKRQR
jgi:hypothetical protein